MPFKSPYHTPLEAAMDYDFVAETSPGVWRVYGRANKAEYLAHGITDRFLDNPAQSGDNPDRTEHWKLLQPNQEDGYMSTVAQILRHENLVSLIDIVQMRATGHGAAPGRERWYAIWDMCDAGTLSNLFTPDVSHGPRVQDEDTVMDGTTGKPPVLTKFLPESFCWHVACSLLKGLAWLHDGTTGLEWNAELNTAVEMGPRDPDWHAILHRNIAPENIFFQHPRRAETYGLCKLGNFGSAFVSGHGAVRADAESDIRRQLVAPQGPHTRYVVGPPQGKSYVDIHELRANDWRYRDAYPPMDDQPYTMLSEYRAVGEILQAMMVTPAHNEKDHMRTVRSGNVRDNLRLVDYSLELRTFVQTLMEMSADQLLRSLEEAAGWRRSERGVALITNCTSALYARATALFYWFRAVSTNLEDRRLIMRDEEIQREAAEDANRYQTHHNIERLRDRILDAEDRREGIIPTTYKGKPKRAYANANA